MFHFKNYKLGFDWRGLLMFLTFVFPFILWIIIPKTKPIEIISKTPVNDIFEIIFNVLLLLSLTFVINTHSKKFYKKVYLFFIMPFKILYYICWVIAYFGIYNHFLTMAICIIPGLTFMAFSISRKNLPGLIFSVGFSVCHIIFTVMNVLVF